MKYTLYRLVICLMASSIFFSCAYTDLPVSFNFTLPDNRLVGLWTEEDAEYIYEVKIMKDGKANFFIYSFDKQKRKFLRNPKFSQLYFYDIPSSDLKKYSFLSVAAEDNKYSTINYSFLNNNSVRAVYLTYKPAESFYQENGDYYKFGTITNHQNSVTNNLHNKDNYSKAYTLSRVTNLAALEYKISQKLINNTTQIIANNTTASRPSSSNIASNSISQSETLNAPIMQVSNSEQSYKLSQYYSYYDVYYIQSYYQNNNCITVNHLIRGGGTWTSYKTVEKYFYDDNGNLQFSSKEIPVENRIDQYTAYNYKNTCPYRALVKGINKYENNGSVSYQDGSFLLDPKEEVTFDGPYEYIDYYNASKATAWSRTFYKNNLPIDKNIYNNYIKTIANKLRGTIAVMPKSNRTRIYLNTGDKIIIKANGSVKLSNYYPSSDPNGIETKYTMYNITDKAKYGSLIYKIGDSGEDEEWSFVGNNTIITAHKSGILKLAVNDTDDGDNVGEYIIDYEVIRAR